MSEIRLDKFISSQTLFSRSDCRKLITKGRVTVDGVVVRSFSEKIDDEANCVAVDGTEIVYNKFVYFIINKPKGVLSASEDKKRKTVVDLLPEEFSSRDIFPVGRLDKDTTGLLILTDDGQTAHRIIGPKFKIEKAYIVELDGIVEQKLINCFEQGVVLKDGYRCEKARLEILNENTARVIITEGKYHQIKRMFGVFGLGVNNLKRERIGNLYLPENLMEGEFLPITYEALKQKIGFN